MVRNSCWRGYVALVGSVSDVSGAGDAANRAAARSGAQGHPSARAVPFDPPPLKTFFCTEKVQVLYTLFSVSGTFWPC